MADRHLSADNPVPSSPGQAQGPAPTGFGTGRHGIRDARNEPSIDQGEIYAGVKFTLHLTPGPPPADARVAELTRWCRRFDALGLAPTYGDGAHGNLSFRLVPGAPAFVITAPQSRFDVDIPAAALVVVASVDLDAGIVHAVGDRAPSSESQLHASLYARFPDVHAVFHGHCQALLDRAAELGLPRTAREAPYGSIDLVREVLGVADEGPVVIMTRHGFVSMGRSMDEAGSRVARLLDRIVTPSPP